MTNTTKLINQGEKSGRFIYYLSKAKEPLRFVVFYALFYGLLRLVEFGSFKLFIGGGMPQSLQYTSFLVAVTTGIMSQLLLDFAIFIAFAVVLVAAIYIIRLGVKWLMNRSDAAIDTASAGDPARRQKRPRVCPVRPAARRHWPSLWQVRY